MGDFFNDSDVENVTPQAPAGSNSDEVQAPTISQIEQGYPQNQPVQSQGLQQEQIPQNQQVQQPYGANQQYAGAPGYNGAPIPQGQQVYNGAPYPEGQPTPQYQGYQQGQNGYNNGYNAYNGAGYGQLGYNGPYGNGYPTPQKEYNGGFGIASMILGILSLLLFCTCANVPLMILSVVFAIVHISRKTNSNVMAIVGIITSAVSLVLMLIFWWVMIRNVSNDGYDNIFDLLNEYGYEYEYENPYENFFGSGGYDFDYFVPGAQGEAGEF